MPEQPAIREMSPFASGTAEAVVERAANIAATGMPLPAGLRAAAQESDSRQVAQGLKGLARELERGRSLVECIEGAGHLPSHLRGLIRAAQRTGNLGLTLSAWTANRRSARQYWRAIVASLAYPAISLALAIAVYVFFGLVVVQPFRKMFEEFGLKLPAATAYLFQTTEFGLRFLPLAGGFIVAIAIGTRLFGGRVGWSWLIGTLPLIGSAWHWTGVAEMLRCLSLLIDARVPLPEALRLAADGLTDAYVADQCRALAGSVDNGRSLTMAIVDLRTLPLSIAPMIRWGELHDSLGAALRSAAETIEDRLRLRTHVLAQVIPPVVFVMVGITIASAVTSLFLPLISLIQGLS